MNTSVSTFENQKVLVIGDVMLDTYIAGDVKRISPEAPVPVLSVTSTEHRLGGAGNVANNLAALGAAVRLLSCWGKDTAGNRLTALLEKLNVDTAFARQCDEYATTQKTRLVSQNHQLLRYDTERPETAYDAYAGFLSEHPDALFDGVSAVILSDYAKGLVTKRTAHFVIQGARERNIPVVVDPKGRNYHKYRSATVCTPNVKELTEAADAGTLDSEEDMLQTSLALIHQYDFDYLLVTRAEKGLSLIKNEEKLDFPAAAREVSDVTGAGDTVAAVFALGLGAGFSPEACCTLANKAAAIVVSKFGAATASPDELLLPHSKKIALSGQSLAEKLRRQGRKIVFTNGCFDLIHAGHIKSFEQAKAFGDVLIVGLNSDRSVRALKGFPRPIVSQDDRAKLLCALSCVDYVVVFDEDTPELLIKEIRPNVLVKGADWSSKPVAGQDAVEASGGRVEFIELEQGLSTTSIIERVRKVVND